MYAVLFFVLYRTREVSFLARQRGHDKASLLSERAVWVALVGVAGGLGVLSVPDTQSRPIHFFFAFFFFGAMSLYMLVQLRIDRQLHFVPSNYPVCFALRVAGVCVPLVIVLVAAFAGIIYLAAKGHHTISKDSKSFDAIVGLGSVIELCLFLGYAVFFGTFSYVWKSEELKAMLDVQTSEQMSETIQHLLHS
eukprot:c10401_g1_i2.p1 GENE.c10401_g1_i2~~c10401_g1_i2.p1  ORF type:complete len:193 (-),score=35.58 c10401_g1_i2:28-606(-)